MVVCAGTRLGPYEILAPIGAGGMGEVWKARDTRLDRIVAVKVSADQFTERFEREARAVAKLNHPHICTLHDVGPNYLVMEYIEGQTLKGPLPLDQALRYGAQICDALDAAHRKDIVHRDLKPANILVTKSGIKLLDFGLAKMNHVRVADGNTETIALTEAHTILGTLQYMAPEQLEGKDADSRSDIFAFGAVLYEMLTGKRAFEGKSQVGVIAAIMEHDPPSVGGIAPAALDRVLRRCLAKDADERWQSARDLKAELEWIGESVLSPVGAPALSRRRQPVQWIAAAALLAAIVLYFAVRPRPAPAAGEVTRFAIYPPEKTTFSAARNITVPTPQFDMSPDGRAMVFVASATDGKLALWLRPLTDPAAHPIPGTENAEYPFWSPDSRWIGFFSDGKLKKVLAAGGPVQVISEGFADFRGGSWGAANTILLATALSHLYGISSSSGAVAAVTRLDASNREAAHRWPQFLPDGQHFLFRVISAVPANGGVYAGSLDGKTRKFLIRSDLSNSASYAPPGYVLFLDGDTLMAQKFDAEHLELRDQPLPVAEHVGRSSAGKIAVSASGTGVLAYAGAILRLGRLTWFDRNGNRLDSVGPEGDYTDFRLSPDEKRIAISLVDPKTSNPDVWLVDRERGSTSRFTFGQALNASAVWSPDGAWIAFRTNPTGLTELYRKSAAGGGNEEPVLSGEAERSAQIASARLAPSDWSPDGRDILFAAPGAGSGYDLWLWSLTGEKKLKRFLGSPYDKIHGNFSPDGKLVAYSSNESGRFEVHVQTFPRSDRQWQVSTGGGSEPRWRRDGREIYYLSEDRKLMAVAVGAGPLGNTSFGVPKPLFQTRAPAGVYALRTNYVPSGDGKRFLVNTQNDPAPTPITVVLNWTSGLKRN